MVLSTQAFRAAAEKSRGPFSWSTDVAKFAAGRPAAKHCGAKKVKKHVATSATRSKNRVDERFIR
jgi:hypothetical protein